MAEQRKPKQERYHSRTLPIKRPQLRAPDKLAEARAAVERESLSMLDPKRKAIADRARIGDPMDDPEMRHFVRMLMSFTGEPWREPQIGDIRLPED